MSKARKKFVIYAAVSLFVLIAVLLFVINMMGFTMAAQDADRITSMIASGNGEFAARESSEFKPEKRGPMGVDSPEIRSSVRYYTFRFDKKGNGEKIAFNISAVSEEQAKTVAASLLGENTGWVNTTYRYRVYRHDGFDYVTVIDYGRELLQAYRTLTVSVIGALICIAVSVVFLTVVGKKLFKPLEEADRKQKNFIKEAERSLKVPLTVISSDTELIEREFGSGERTQSINRQIKKLTEITKQLHSLSILDETGENKEKCDLSMLLLSATDRKKNAFQEKGITLEVTADTGVTVSGDAAALNGMIQEIVENALKFSLTRASFELKNENGLVRFTSSNDTDLKTGSTDQIFDRFTRLENAKGKAGNGLGLSYVKDAVKAHNGRMSAGVADGVFTLRITL